MNFESLVFEASLVMVSDVHLKHQEDPRSRLLLDLIRKCRSHRVQNFILLGDIFEFFLGSSPYFLKKFAYLQKELEDLAASGCRVFFFEGNHEFHMNFANWAGVEMISEGEREIQLPDGHSVVCAHGDLVYAAKSYLWFRNLVKSRAIHTFARLLPQRFLDSYALTHAKVSRASDYARSLDKRALQTQFNTWAHRFPHASLGLFGHFHTNLSWQSSPGPSPMLFASGSSWSTPSAFLLKSNQLFRVSLDPDQPLERAPAVLLGKVHSRRPMTP